MTLHAPSWPGRIAVAVEPGGEEASPLRLAASLAAAYGAELVTLTARDREAGRSPRPTSSAGAPRALCRASRRAEADLLVLGRGVGWADHLYLLESVAERVVATAPVPVLVVPEDGVTVRMPSAPTILVTAPDGATCPVCLDWGASLARRLAGRVEVVGTEGEGRRSALDALHDAAVRYDASLLVVSRRGRDAGRRKAPSRRLPVVAAGLCRTAPCPVLFVPAPRPVRRPAADTALDSDTPARAQGRAAGPPPTPVRWHLRRGAVQRRPTDTEALGP